MKAFCQNFLLLTLAAISVGAQTVTETFTGSTAAGWVLGGNSYTPQLTSGSIDPTNDGWLRLTDNANNRATYAYYDTAVTSANRTVFTSFDYASYNGSGADGITFFLFDGSATFSEGAFGGSMGYAPKTITGGGEVNKEGLAGGYLAVSLDDFGNFSNPTEGRTGGPGSRPNSVAVRGPGSGYDGYEFIVGTGDGTTPALTEQMDFPTYTTRPDQTGIDYRHVEILITPTNQLTVWLQFGVDGALTKVLEADLSGYLRPETLKFGFTSGTGGSTEIHELRALTVATLVANLWDNGSNGGSSATGDWSVAENWNPDVPTTGDDILFDNTFVSSSQTVNVGAGMTRTIRSIQIDAPFSYTLNNGTIEFDDVGLPGFLGISVTQTNGVSATGNTINSAIALKADTTIRNATTSTLTLNGNIANGGNALIVDGAGNTTATGVISGTGSLIKEQQGNLTLSGSNTYSGGTAISGGTITAAHNNALGSGGVTMTGGTLAGSGSRTIANTVSIQGDAGITNLTLSNTLTQSGDNRTLTLDTATLGAVALSENNTGRTLTTHVTGDSTISGVISNGGTGAGGLTKTGDATLTLSGNNLYTGTTTISEGTIKLGASDRLSNSSNLNLAGGTLALDGNSERVNNLTVSADSNLDFGAGGNSNYFLFNDLTGTPSGVLSVYNWEQGSDILASAATLSSAELDMFYFVGYGAGATHSAAQTVGTYGSGWDPINPNTSGWYTWDSGNNDNRWDRGANWSPNLSNGWTSTSSTKVAFGTGSQTTVDLRAGRMINAMRFDVGSSTFNIGANQGDTLTFSGPNANSVAFIQQNSESDQSLTMGTVSLARNLVVDMAGSGDLTITSALTGSKNLIKENSGGKLILSGNSSTYSGGVFINNGVVQITSDDALGNTTGATTISDGAALELSGGSVTSEENINLSGTGISSGGAIRSVAGTNTLSGTLTLDADSRINADVGATLTLDNTVTGAGKNLTLGGVGDTTVSGVISTVTGTVTKDGSGTLTYTGAGANTYTGVTTVNAGTLVLNKNAGTAAIAGNLVIGDGVGSDVVRLDQNNQIADTATVTLNSSGVLNVNGKTEMIAGLNASSGTAQVQLGTGSALTVNNSTANTYAGALTGDGTLTKSGVGRLTISGTDSTFSGTTNVNSGIVALGNGTALGTSTVNVLSTGNVEIQGTTTVANTFNIAGDGTGANDGAIENFSGNNTLTGNITLGADARIGSSSGTLTLSGAGTLTAPNANKNLTFSGAGNTIVNRNINTGTGTLTKEGSGNLTLNVANAYTGATTISAGKITAGTTGIFSDAASLTLQTGAVYDMAGNSETVGSLQGGGAGAGGSINFDGATLTLAGGASSFGGDFGFSNGTIVINAGQSLTLTDSFNAANINIVLNGGSLFLGSGLTHTFGDLIVNTGTGSVIDFGTSGSTIAEFSSVNVTGAGTLTVNNWTDMVDYFLATTSPGPQGSSPTNKVVFDGFTGSDTKWRPLIPGSGGSGQLTPVPEPSTYGALMLGSAVAFLFLRRRRRA